MTVIRLSEFGRILTGREYGLNTAQKIVAEHKPPFELDFEGVISLGSSFGDEIFKAIASLDQKPIRVTHTNKAVKNALLQVQEDLNIQLEWG